MCVAVRGSILTLLFQGGWLARGEAVMGSTRECGRIMCEKEKEKEEGKREDGRPSLSSENFSIYAAVNEGDGKGGLRGWWGNGDKNYEGE